MSVEARLHLDCNARQSLTRESHREGLGRDTVLWILPLKRFCIPKATNLINKGYAQSALKNLSCGHAAFRPCHPTHCQEADCLSHLPHSAHTFSIMSSSSKEKRSATYGRGFLALQVAFSQAFWSRNSLSSALQPVSSSPRDVAPAEEYQPVPPLLSFFFTYSALQRVHHKQLLDGWLGKWLMQMAYVKLSQHSIQFGHLISRPN